MISQPADAHKGTTLKARLLKIAAIILAALVSLVLYAFLLNRVFGMKPPKTVMLERQNRDLLARLEVIDQRLDVLNGSLLEMEMRDNTVYRPIFGMDRIPSDVRNSGFGGVERYSAFDGLIHSRQLVSTEMKMDILTKKAGIQTKSLDEISVLSKRAGDMAASVPNFNPVDLTTGRVVITSPFGARFHPVFQQIIIHTGLDLAGPVGEPIYATGDGVVESAEVDFYGYGNSIVIDHGFGYKTRYAHLRNMHVFKGQKVHRGDQIATIGNSGRTTGPHLHYEVLYMGNNVDPANYLNNDLTQEEYRSMLHPVKEVH
ncbi:MAG: M23 family metallopeptidase [Bacteroidales bacterium]|nr:M23 family metallopeptidase [Bacteroidales bacterium]